MNTSPEERKEITHLTLRQMLESFPVVGPILNNIFFEFRSRDAGGILLASYTLPITPASPYTTVGIPYARFKNLTLVIKGLEGTTSGTNAFGIFPVPHY